MAASRRHVERELPWRTSMDICAVRWQYESIGRNLEASTKFRPQWRHYRWALAAAVALYLVSPAFNATHVEGFTALIQMNAIAAHLGMTDRADLLYPVQTEYFYLTRQGVILLLRGLMSLSGSYSDALFRLLTFTCFVVFLACTALVAKRHSRLPWIAIFCSLVVIPGLFELGFYFSDNVVSVAFGMLGLALLPGPAMAASSLPRPWTVRLTTVSFLIFPCFTVHSSGLVITK